MIIAKSSGTPRELVPAGNYIARCYSMILIGTVKELYQGQERLTTKVRLTWELPTKMKIFDPAKGEQPMAVSQEFTLSMAPKANLRKFLEGWRGKGFTDKEAESFDITKLLGLPCMLNVIHKTSAGGNDYEVISSASGMPDGVKCPDPINIKFEFNYDDKFSDMAVEAFPDFIKEKIKSSEEYKKKMAPEHTEVKQDEDFGMEPATADGNEDVPF
jgi:hypothetical protein